MRHYRFVSPLTEDAREQLERVYRESADFTYRRRAHAILLSHQQVTIPQMTTILDVDRDTISLWISDYERAGLEGLKPRRRPGRPPIYSDEELHQFAVFLAEEPRQIRQAQAKLQEMTGKTSSTSTLKRALKANSTIPGGVAGVR